MLSLLAGISHQHANPTAPSAPRVLWIDIKHGGLDYYDAFRKALIARGLQMVEHELDARGWEPMVTSLKSSDAAILGFGWMSGEKPFARFIRELTPFSYKACNESNSAEHKHARHQPACLCGRLPLLVLLNKEYTLMPQKYAWFKSHCVTAAFTVHHQVAEHEQASGTPFYRISFGVDSTRFAAATSIATEVDHSVQQYGYEYDIGFTGVLRKDQTDNWRSRIFRESWPKLSKHGTRLYTGEKGGVHAGVAHAELNATEYVRRMHMCKAWLSTTGPVDLVGTRFFEVMATGTTLLVANRVKNDTIYESLGITEHRHALLFSTLSEFEAIVRNLSNPLFEIQRKKIIHRAKALVDSRFSWVAIASRIDAVLRCSIAGGSGSSRSCAQLHSRRHHYSVVHNTTTLLKHNN